ncbi:MAG: hypothetical protein RJR35_03455 [Thermoanaerobacterales bacterium]|nr:hypothetical protein [Thermoanaerobacterales bacterium]
MPSFLITHDIALARKVSDRMAVMLKGNIVEEGPTNEIVHNPLHPYTKCLIEAAPSLSKEVGTGSRTENCAENREAVALSSATTGSQSCPFIKRCPQPLPRCFQEKPGLKACSVHRVACFRRVQD